MYQLGPTPGALLISLIIMLTLEIDTSIDWYSSTRSAITSGHWCYIYNLNVQRAPLDSVTSSMRTQVLSLVV